MPSAENFEWPQGNPLFEVQWRTVTESLAGNGIVSNGDFEVTATATDMEISVATGTAFYVGSNYDLGAAETHVLSDGDANDDRWDTVYFDTGTSTSGVREGTPEANPEPPDIQGGELLLAVVYVPAGATNISDQEILNWRAKFSNEAEEVHYDDDSGDYGVNNVEAALDAIDLDFVRGRDNSITGPFDVSGTAGPIDLGTNPGAYSSIVDAEVDGTDAAGTEESYTFSIDASDLVKFYAESDGAGGIQNAEVQMLVSTTLQDGDIVTSEIATDAVTATEIADEVDLDEMRSRSNSITGKLADIGTNPGAFGALVDGTVDGGSAASTVHSYAFSLDGQNLIIPEVESDGSGGTQNPRVTVPVPVALVAQSGTPSHAAQGTEYYDTDDETPKYANSSGTYQRPISRVNTEEFNIDESGTVSAGDSGVAYVTQLADTRTIEVFQAGLILADGQAAPSDLDLIIATLDNAGGATVRNTIIAGDGTVQSDETGSPLSSYQNQTGNEVTVAFLVDNGNFNAGTGSAQDIFATAHGEVK